MPILREFLLRGGTLTLDDFHGPYEWELTEKQLKRVFPDREIVEIEPPHPIYTCFYRIDKYPQIPGLGSFLSGRTWEKGGFAAHLRGILDDAGRPMVLINWNTDMGDGVEWSNARGIPGLHQVDRAGLPDADQRSDLLADALRTGRRSHGANTTGVAVEGPGRKGRRRAARRFSRSCARSSSGRTRSSMRC